MQKSFTVKEMDDTLISPYLNSNELPTFLNSMLGTVERAEEKDILLMSTLTACSCLLHRIYFRHGQLQKKYYPNLQTFIMAGAASGKGVANQAQALLRDIHERESLFIPGDSTYPAFFKQLAEQGGIGYMHESEGSVITDIWKSGAMSYNTALRKAAEHETLSRSRVTGKEEIVCPRVSMLLTGTFDQFQALVPSVQNGFFSRLSMLVIRGHKEFDKKIFIQQNKKGSDVMRQLSQQICKFYEKLCQRKTETLFRLTEKQAESLGEYFANEYGELLQSLGENFHPSIVRMGITVMRIACILSALRYIEEEVGECIVCKNEDYRTAVTIASKLLLHAADAYEQIKGKSTPTVPEQKGCYQQRMLLAALPTAFTHKDLMKQSQQSGVNTRTAERWLNEWQERGIMIRMERGSYKKCA